MRTKNNKIVKLIFIMLSLVIVFISIISMTTKTAISAKHLERKPNIIFIMADDLTMTDIEPFGSKQVHTPNMAKLASEGMCLDNMFNMVPVCSPTRQSLLTGLGPVRNGAYPNHTMIYDGIKTLPTYMQELGYNTALIGKRHYAPESSYPFDFLGGRDHDDGSGIDIDLTKASEYIRKSADKPFLLMFTSNQPHSPWTRGNQKAYDPEKIKLNPNMLDTKLTRKNMANYFAEITYLDSLVGVCMDMVDRSGQKENTIIMLVTEQGNSFPFSKWTLYDQGLHSGMIVKWPGKVKPGSRNPAMLEYADITPTLIEIGGGNPSKINTGSKDGFGDTGFDGESFIKVLRSETNHMRDFVYAENTTVGIFDAKAPYAIRSVRSADYLYIRNLNYQNKFTNTVTNSKLFAQWMEKDAQRAGTYQTRPEEELYAVKGDPYQLKNLALDPQYFQIKKGLKDKLISFMKQQNDKGIETEMKALSRQPKNNLGDGDQ
ncbi:sulfatase [Pedobacter fastidiosus]|uniref:Sulfatase n=1 Tax=Pedobacter fastidiosus TaxID=2765361 RepID=A0ABR7KS04_9SPHI|nr:sulfatase [Pedobacter fastidiosus]MBC6110879.1 sulfatase [Pedobacter fastidiosus]